MSQEGGLRAALGGADSSRRKTPSVDVLPPASRSIAAAALIAPLLGSVLRRSFSGAAAPVLGRRRLFRRQKSTADDREGRGGGRAVGAGILAGGGWGRGSFSGVWGSGSSVVSLPPRMEPPPPAPGADVGGAQRLRRPRHRAGAGPPRRDLRTCFRIEPLPGRLFSPSASPDRFVSRRGAVASPRRRSSSPVQPRRPRLFGPCSPMAKPRPLLRPPLRPAFVSVVRCFVPTRSCRERRAAPASREQSIR